MPMVYVLSDAGTTSANGSYTQEMILQNDGKSYFVKGLNEAFIFWNSGIEAWLVGSVLGQVGGSWYVKQEDTELPPLTGWATYAGTLPVPTVIVEG